MPFPQPTEQVQPHKFVDSDFKSKDGSEVYCGVCGMGRHNRIHTTDIQNWVMYPEGRLDPQAYLLAVLRLTALRSTCKRGQVGALIHHANGTRILASGYNGAPPGMPHCIDVGCDPPDGCERTIHAEANAIAWAARVGVTLNYMKMTCTHSPCLSCAKLILASGISHFDYLEDYRLGRLDVLTDGPQPIKVTKIR